MNGWQLISEEVAARIWNENLFRFDHYSPFQVYEQGQYEKGLGWKPQYWVFFDENSVAQSMFLGLLRSYPFGFGFIQCVGGPAGDLTKCDSEFHRKLVEATKLFRIYLRVRWEKRNCHKSAAFLNRNNWFRSLFSMTSGLTMELDISGSESSIVTGYSGKWRRNLRIAQRTDVSILICSEPNPDQLRAVFAEMEARKNLRELFSTEKLRKFFQTAGESVLFLECRDSNGELLAFRAAIVAGNRASDYFAATSEKGRDLRISYLLFTEMVRHLKSKGVIIYDLGGIDPKANPGVYTFKKGTGAKEVEFLGEWEWASSEWLRVVGNWAISQRHRLRSPKTTIFGGKKQKWSGDFSALPAQGVEIAKLKTAEN
jgi:hypothetical protein